MTSSIDARLPRYQRLYDDFAARIARREWLPGEPIPSESELAKAHGVAIGTVRKAIDQLVLSGVLERQQGRGTFVRRVRFNSALFRFFRFQAESGERRIPQSRILQRQVTNATPTIAAALGLHADDPVIRLSRLRLIDDVPLLAEEIWLPRSRFEPLLQIEPHAFGDLLYPLYEERCGQVVASAEETLSVELADPLRARLLQREPGAPLIAIERTAFDFERRPLEWRCSRGPADRFRYHVEIR